MGEVAAQAFHHLIVLKAVEYSLEQHRKLGGRGHLLALEGTLPSTLMNNKVELGGGAWRVVYEDRGPTGGRGRRRHGLAHPWSLKDETGALVFVIRLDSHHAS